MEVSIIIVNYKTAELLDKCIGSIYEHSEGFTFEIIVVDNNSEDESKNLITNKFPSVKWMDMASNMGFGCANNKGIINSAGDYTLLLNSDTELYENTILETLRYYYFLEKKNQKIGFLGCQIKHQDGRLQPSCNYYWSGIREAFEEHPIGIKILQHWLKIQKLRSIDKYKKLNSNHEVIWLGVPFALINSRVIKKYNFDEQFFMYSEDEELNFRLSKNGFKHFYFSKYGIYHHIGASTKSSDARNKQITISKWLFIKKSRGNNYFRLYKIIYRSALKWNYRYSKDNKYKIELTWLNDFDEMFKKSLESKTSINCYK